MLVNNDICTSKREAREFIKNGAILINGEKIMDENTIVTDEMLHLGSLLIIRKGKKKYYLGIKGE